MAFTDSQQLAYNMLTKGNSVFIEGPAGTGKSYLITEFLDWAKKHNKKALVLAPTGRAAMNIGGTTIHRQFRLGVEPQVKMPQRASKLLREVDILLIDEISMCRIDLFDYVMTKVKLANDYRKKRVEKIISAKDDRNGNELLAPIQVVLVGDFCQLAPVVTPEDKQILDAYYGEDVGNGYCFQSRLWHSYGFRYVLLKEIVRQTDAEFANALNMARIGNPACVDFLNMYSSSIPIDNALWLYSRNAEVERLNKWELNKIKEKEVHIKCHVNGNVMVEDTAAEPELVLKRGARVMTTSNDIYGRYVNGSLGYVENIQESQITVALDNGNRVKIQKQNYLVTENFFENQNLVTRTIGSVEQFPLRLAWAITIHKSQGCTLDAVNIDPRVFTDGQLYVALSRARSIERIYLDGSISGNELLVNKEVLRFEGDPIRYRFFTPAKGGKIAGSGRKKKESGPTVRVRIPERYLSQVTKYIEELKEKDGFKD